MTDFSKQECISTTESVLFGICDDENGMPAYLDDNDKKKWICIVDNYKRFECAFTAVDNCIEIRRENGDMDHRCDGVLEYDNHIVFIELKRDRTGGTIPHGIKQLESVISHFFAQKESAKYGKKRAVLANSKKPRFQWSHQSKMEEFKSRNAVRLIIGAEIKLK